MATEQELGWLAGFFDGEGYLANRRGNKPLLGIENTDKALLEKAQSILDSLEIDSRLSLLAPRSQATKQAIVRQKPLYRLCVYSYSGLIRFFKSVPVASTAKLSRWNELKAYYSRPSLHSRARRERITRQYPALL